MNWLNYVENVYELVGKIGRNRKEIGSNICKCEENDFLLFLELFDVKLFREWVLSEDDRMFVYFLNLIDIDIEEIVDDFCEYWIGSKGCCIKCIECGWY